VTLRRIVGLALAALCTAWFGWYAWQALPAIDPRVLAAPSTWLGVAAAALLYAAIIPISGWAWARLLAAQGEVHRPGALALLMARTQLAKYLPGNVAQHALRLALALRAGIRLPVHVSTVLQETLLAIAASLLVGVVAMASDPRGRALLAGLDLPGAGWMLAAGLAAIVVGGVVLPRLARRWRPLALLALPAPTVSAQALLAYALNYLLIGVGLTLLARAIGLPATLGLAAATGAFALSWILGFLAPGTPAGLGVREGLMVALLAGAAPDPQVLVFVVLARVSTMLGDGLCFMVGWGASARVQEEDA
jgi:uncharacterized membrane protein YbhN (UPF0104 family)